MSERWKEIDREKKKQHHQTYNTKYTYYLMEQCKNGDLNMINLVEEDELELLNIKLANMEKYTVDSFASG